MGQVRIPRPCPMAAGRLSFSAAARTARAQFAWTCRLGPGALSRVPNDQDGEKAAFKVSQRALLPQRGLCCDPEPAARAKPFCQEPSQEPVLSPDLARPALGPGPRGVTSLGLGFLTCKAKERIR